MWPKTLLAGIRTWAKAVLLGTGPQAVIQRWILTSWKWPSTYRRWTLPFLFFGRSEAATQAGRAWTVATSPHQDPPSSRGHAGTDRIAGDWLAPLSVDAPFAHLGEIGHPTLVVNGVQDVMIATINSWHLSQNIPNAQLIVYPDAGHGAQFQYPERFLRHLTQFLDE
jgi:pimeloyl-ACP methyl ester carboxylesterase